MKRKNNYGYKIGYIDEQRNFIRKFITQTYQQAHRTLLFYRKYGHECGRRTREFNYKIKPITKKEILAGIWDEIPDYNFFYLSARRFLKSRKRCKVAIKSCDHEEFICKFNARFLNAIRTIIKPSCTVYFPFEIFGNCRKVKKIKKGDF